MKPTGLQKVNYGRHIIMAYPFATCIILVIWVICLMPIPETPLSHLTLFDKWMHITRGGVGRVPSQASRAEQNTPFHRHFSSSPVDGRTD